MLQISFYTNNKNLGISSELNQARSKKYDNEELQESYQDEAVEIKNTKDIDRDKLQDTNIRNYQIKIILLEYNQKVKFTFCINTNKTIAHLIK